MTELLLIKPSLHHKDEILNYKQEFIDHCDSMDGTAGLQNCDTIETWMKNIERNSNQKTLLPNMVAASTFLAIRAGDNKLVGMVDIRHELNDFLLKSGGHIGYSVRYSQRRQGYAKQILKLALEECKKIGLNKVLVTCNENNIGSTKSIDANNGILENKVEINGNIKCRYWIAIDS